MRIDIFFAELKRRNAYKVAINYAQNRSGEIRFFNSSGNLGRIIPFTEADRKL